MKTLNIMWQLFLLSIVLLALGAIYFIQQTPSISQIKTDMYKEQIAKVNQAKQQIASSTSNLREAKAKANIIINWLFTCFNIKTDERQNIDNVEWFRLWGDECITSWDICLIKWDWTCKNSI